MNYSSGLPAPALVPVAASAQVSGDSLYSPICLSNLVGSRLRWDLTSLRDLRRVVDFSSLFSFLLVVRGGVIQAFYMLSWKPEVWVQLLKSAYILVPWLQCGGEEEDIHCIISLSLVIISALFKWWKIFQVISLCLGIREQNHHRHHSHLILEAALLIWVLSWTYFTVFIYTTQDKISRRHNIHPFIKSPNLSLVPSFPSCYGKTSYIKLVFLKELRVQQGIKVITSGQCDAMFK